MRKRIIGLLIVCLLALSCLLSAYAPEGAKKDAGTGGDAEQVAAVILPYSNDIITVRVSGQILLDALEFGVSKLPAVSGGFPQVSGLSFRVNPNMPSSVVTDDKGQFVSAEGECRVSDVQIGGEPLDPEAEYTLTGSSYTLSGGDGYTMFKKAEVLNMTMLPDNEVVIRYLEDYLGGVIPEDYRQAQGRILMQPKA